MDDLQLDDLMRNELRAVWHRYMDGVQPFRPPLGTEPSDLPGTLVVTTHSRTSNGA